MPKKDDTPDATAGTTTEKVADNATANEREAAASAAKTEAKEIKAEGEIPVVVNPRIGSATLTAEIGGKTRTFYRDTPTNLTEAEYDDAKELKAGSRDSLIKAG